MARICLLLSLLALYGAVQVSAQQSRECTYDDYKQCFSDYKKFKKENKHQQVTAEILDKKCSLFWAADDCMLTYKDVCEKVNKWEEITAVGFGLKNKMRELCNNTDSKNEFLKNQPCLNENRDVIKECKKNYHVVREEGESKDHIKKACCKGKATYECTFSTIIPKCPGSKNVMELLANKRTEKTKDYCESKGYLAQCLPKESSSPRP